jgi:hypothetical protein
MAIKRNCQCAATRDIAHHNGLFVAAVANKQARRTSLIMEFSLARFLSGRQRRSQSHGLAGSIFD